MRCTSLFRKSFAANIRYSRLIGPLWPRCSVPSPLTTTMSAWRMARTVWRLPSSNREKKAGSRKSLDSSGVGRAPWVSDTSTVSTV